MKKVFALFGHNRPVRMIKFNREGDIVVTCGDDGAVCMWSSNNAKLLAQFQSKDAVPAFDIDYDTKTIITAQVTAGVVMYDCENGSEIGRIPLNGRTRYCEFAYGDKEILTLNSIKGVKHLGVYQTKDLKPEKKVKLGEKEIKREIERTIPGKDIILEKETTQASWGNLNESIYVSTDDGFMEIYDVGPSLEKRLSKKIGRDSIVSFTFSSDHILLFACCKDSYVYMVEPDSLNELNRYSYEGNIPRCVAISPLYKESIYTRLGVMEENAKEESEEKGREEEKSVEESKGMMEIERVKEETEENENERIKYHIIVGGGQDDREVTQTSKKAGGFEMKLFNFITQEEIAILTGHFGPVHYVSFSPDGMKFASGSQDGMVRLHFFSYKQYFSSKYQ